MLLLERERRALVSEQGDLRIPIVEEQATVSKRAVETERVRVRTMVETHEALVRDTVLTEVLEVERRPVERPVAETPPPREEGDCTIISIVEERAVVTKQLFVVEEVVVRRVATREPVSAPVSLRAMRAVVERDPVQQQEEH